MSEFEKSLDTCSQCRFCRKIGDDVEGNPRWICSANPPVWDGTAPWSPASYIQPMVFPDTPVCRFFENTWKAAKRFREGLD